MEWYKQKIKLERNQNVIYVFKNFLHQKYEYYCKFINFILSLTEKKMIIVSKTRNFNPFFVILKNYKINSTILLSNRTSHFQKRMNLNGFDGYFSSRNCFLFFSLEEQQSLPLFLFFIYSRRNSPTRILFYFFL